MKGAYDMYPLGLRLSHLALLRNLDRFTGLSQGARGQVLVRANGHDDSVPAGRAAEYINWYVDFLDVHHRGEDEHIFAALRKHTAGRSTDAAHLDSWAAEHREIYRVAQALRASSRALASSAAGALDGLQRVAIELKALLSPHLQAEEDVLTADHLKEMISERELERAQLAIPRSQGIDAASTANFFVHSLEPSEQRELLGETPWFFRKIVLGAFGARKARRFGPLMPVREVSL